MERTDHAAPRQRLHAVVERIDEAIDGEAGHPARRASNLGDRTDGWSRSARGGTPAGTWYRHCAGGGSESSISLISSAAARSKRRSPITQRRSASCMTNGARANCSTSHAWPGTGRQQAQPLDGHETDQSSPPQATPAPTRQSSVAVPSAARGKIRGQAFAGTNPRRHGRDRPALHRVFCRYRSCTRSRSQQNGFDGIGDNT